MGTGEELGYRIEDRQYANALGCCREDDLSPLRPFGIPARGPASSYLCNLAHRNGAASARQYRLVTSTFDS